VHGFVLHRSILTNAKQHVRKRYVFNVDLENFFPSINFGRVRGLLMAEPFNPTTPLSSALRFSALTMREIRLVMAPLDPGHKGEALLNRIRMQGQHDFE